MYEKFFQFQRSPFNLTPDPHFFFFSRHHEEAFSQILYGIQQRKGFILITGEVGTGKTTVCRLLLEQLDLQIKTALIFNPNLTTIELLQAINQDFGIGGREASKKALLDELNQYLLGALSKGENAVVIVDEAQNLSVECLEEIRMLSNLETGQEKLMQIVLVGQPELRQKLAIPQLRQLNQRIALRYHLQPLDIDMTREYINFRLRIAGGADQVHFTAPALQILHRFSQGVPRLINVICDKALLAAYVAESRVVTAAIMNKALADLEPIPLYTGSFWSWLTAPWSARARWVGATALAAFLALSIAAVLGLSDRMIRPGGGGQDSPGSVNGPVGATAPSGPTQTPAGAIATAKASDSAGAIGLGPSPGPEIDAQDNFDGNLSAKITSTYDSDGIFRVARPQDRERAAYLTLAKLWQADAVVTPQEFRIRDLNGLLETWNLYQYPIPSDYDRILALSYPGLVWVTGDSSKETRAVVLSQADQERAVLLDPVAGRLELSSGEFKRRFTGKGIVLWKEIPGIALPLPQGDPDRSVSTLQAVLKVWGLYHGPVDGILGALTQTAIRAFQEDRGLEPTGQVGLETYLAIAQALAGGKAPSLRGAEPRIGPDRS